MSCLTLGGSSVNVSVVEDNNDNDLVQSIIEKVCERVTGYDAFMASHVHDNIQARLRGNRRVIFALFSPTAAIVRPKRKTARRLKRIKSL